MGTWIEGSVQCSQKPAAGLSSGQTPGLPSLLGASLSRAGPERPDRSRSRITVAGWAVWPWGHHSPSLGFSFPLPQPRARPGGSRNQGTGSCPTENRWRAPTTLAEPRGPPCCRNTWGCASCSVLSSGTPAFSLVCSPNQQPAHPSGARGGFSHCQDGGWWPGSGLCPRPSQPPWREASAAKQEAVGGRGQGPGHSLQRGRESRGKPRDSRPVLRGREQAEEAGAPAQLWGREGALPDTPTPWLPPRASRRTPPPTHLRGASRLCAAKFQ